MTENVVTGHAGAVFVSTACVPGRLGLRERIDSYLEQGLSRIELGAGVRVDEADLSHVTSCGADFLIHNYFPPPKDDFVLNLASADSETRRRSKQFAKQALTLCQALGSPYYSVHSGFVSDPTSFDGTSFVFGGSSSKSAYQNAEARFVDALAELSRFAEAVGVGLLVENNAGLAGMSGSLLCVVAEDIERTLSRPELERVGLLLDTGHLGVSAATRGFDVAAAARRLASRVSALHVHSNRGPRDLHRPVTEAGWIVEELRKGTFADALLVIESKFGTARELAGHVAWLSEVVKTTRELQAQIK